MDKLSNHSTLLLVFFTSILLRLGSLSQKRNPIQPDGVSFLQEEGFEQLNAARMSAAADGLTEANLYFAKQNANKSLLLRQKENL